MPKTKLGKWSLGLIITMPLLMMVGMMCMNIFYPATPAGDTLLQDMYDRPALALFMLAGMTSGIAALITGLIALLKNKERSVFVFVSTAIGALLLFFLIAESISSH